MGLILRFRSSKGQPIGTPRFFNVALLAEKVKVRISRAMLTIEPDIYAKG
jgi:hypothetical protein